MSFSWEIKVKGFGPFAAQAGGKMELGTSRVALYSGNGQGKTCLSRLFRAADSDAGDVVNSTINRDGNAGSFSFTVADNGSQVGDLSVTMNRGVNPVVTNGTDYIFHVFNSDYVRDNLGNLHYSPNGDGFTGYIIGRENVNVSDKKEQLDALAKQGKDKRDAIDSAVNEARARLADLGLTRLKGYREFTTQKILSMDARACQLDDKLMTNLSSSRPSVGYLTSSLRSPGLPSMSRRLISRALEAFSLMSIRETDSRTSLLRRFNRRGISSREALGL